MARPKKVIKNKVRRPTKKALAVREEDPEEVVEKTPKKGILLKVLKQLEVQHGVLSPYDLVEAARDEEHPLHHNFEWNNRIAGEKYRLMTARLLINSVRVEFLGQKREAFFNVTVPVRNVKTRGYVSIDKVVSNAELHRQVVEQAVNELEYWQKKYDSLTELRGVIEPKKLAKVRKKLGR